MKEITPKAVINRYRRRNNLAATIMHMEYKIEQARRLLERQVEKCEDCEVAAEIEELTR